MYQEQKLVSDVYCRPQNARRCDSSWAGDTLDHMMNERTDLTQNFPNVSGNLHECQL